MRRASATFLAAMAMAAAVLALTACDSIHESKDFERHRYSQLSEPRAGDQEDVLYFDVKFDANYPADSDVAEDLRMEWLEEWLAQRKMCPDGFEIDSRRPFDPMEYNPGQYDRRYVVRCRLMAKG